MSNGVVVRHFRRERVPLAQCARNISRYLGRRQEFCADILLLAVDGERVVTIGEGHDLQWNQAHQHLQQFMLKASIGEPVVSKAVSKGLCFLNATNYASKRVLIVEATSGHAAFSKQYVGLMNTFFAAKKSNIIIDVIAIHGHDPSMLFKQGAILCEGEHLTVAPETVTDVLPLLTFHCLRDHETHRILKRREEAVVMSSVCYCHLSPVQMGYVCSTCLAILCKDTVESPQGQCPMCASSFTASVKAAEAEQAASTR
eukprot:GEMP01050805.1.p1 GENE.GEMP01050805.1~~GEMP01050805.1.p1  ORF type:complete len:269 (+),score=44.52 GEMP01050805.1:38-808(+)